MNSSGSSSRAAGNSGAAGEARGRELRFTQKLTNLGPFVPSTSEASSPSPWACMSSSLSLNSCQKLLIRTFHILNGVLASLEKPEE